MNQSVKIVVDLNEKPIFVEPFFQKFPNAEKKSLEVGDIAFYHPAILSNNPILLIERKTISDLIASVNDGRYHEQKIRLKNYQRNSAQPTRVIYLLEGEFKINKFQSRIFNQDKFLGVIINTMVRDKIPVYQTQSIPETLDFLAEIAKRIYKYELKDLITQSNTTTEYSQYIKSNKKANNSPDICYINQLKLITGISQIIAEKIVEKYPSMRHLIEAYQAETNEERRLKMLENLMISEKRRLGPALSRRVYEYLY